MIKLEMIRNSYYGSETLTYEVVGIKDKKLCLSLLDVVTLEKGISSYPQNPNFKLYYSFYLGYYIVNPSTQEKISVNETIKEFFKQFYLK